MWFFHMIRLLSRSSFYLIFFLLISHDSFIFMIHFFSHVIFFKENIISSDSFFTCDSFIWFICFHTVHFFPSWLIHFRFHVIHLQMIHEFMFLTFYIISPPYDSFIKIFHMIQFFHMISPPRDSFTFTSDSFIWFIWFIQSVCIFSCDFMWFLFCNMIHLFLHDSFLFRRKSFTGFNFSDIVSAHNTVKSMVTLISHIITCTLYMQW